MSDPNINRDSNINRSEAEVLRLLVEDVRETVPPTIDSQRISAALIQQIEAEKRFQRVAKAKPAHGQWFVFAAAAALVVVMLSRQGAGPQLDGGAASEAARAQATPIDLRTVAHDVPAGEVVPVYRVEALRSGAVIETAGEPARFRLAGVVAWTLAPNSRVVVRTVRAPHEVALERGAVYAEVVPQLSSDALNESFAVIAGTSRVAVHGTVFSVKRDGDRVLVEVSRGTVSVGPTGQRGPTTGRLLVGPARAAFTTHGGRLAAEQPGPVAEDDSRVAKLAPPRAGPSKPSVATPDGAAGDVLRRMLQPGLPMPLRPSSRGSGDAVASAGVASVEVPPRDDVANAADSEPNTPVAIKLSVDQARAIVLACIYASSDGDAPSDVRVTVSSRVSVKLGEAGDVRAVRFSPPLKPALQQRCGGALFGKSIDAPGAASFRIHFAPR